VKLFTSYNNISLVVHLSYPINLAQNVLTTSLIIWKILKQFRLSSSTGLVNMNRISLITVMRIMVESALIYTVELIFLIICYYMNSPLQFVFQAATVPTIGEEAFILISIHSRGPSFLHP
jgi:hypothetical protein